MRLNRRVFIGTGAAASAVLASPQVFAAGHGKPRVVVVGGGAVCDLLLAAHGTLAAEARAGELGGQLRASRGHFRAHVVCSLFVHCDHCGKNM